MKRIIGKTESIVNIKKLKILVLLVILYFLFGCQQKAERLIRKYENGDQIKKALVMEELIMRLQNGDCLEKIETEIALGKIGDSRAVDPLIIALEAQDLCQRDKAAEALGEIGDPKAVEPLIKALKDFDVGVRIKATKALGKIRDSRAVDPLMTALLDRQSKIQDNSAEALSKLGAEAVEPLINALMDRDIYIKELAAEALGEIGDTAAVIPLIHNLGFYRPSVEAKVAEALSKIGDARAVDALIRALRYNAYPVTRGFAAVGLGKIGDTIAIKPLVYALLDNTIDVREKAVVALESLHWKPQTVLQNASYKIANYQWQECLAIGAKAVEPLIKTLEVDDDIVKNKASEVLIELGPESVEPLLSSLGFDNKEFQSLVIDILGQIRDTRAIPDLVNLLQDWDVSNKSVKALKKIGWKPESINDSIHLLIATRNGYQLKQNWVNTKKVLFNDVTSGNFNQIQNALFAFISLGNQEVIPELIYILNVAGTKNTALAYLNCGKKELSDAAKIWAHKHGYTITISEGSSSVSWGVW